MRIKYNFNLFRVWLKFIVFKTPVTKEVITFVEMTQLTEREKKLLEKIKKINSIE